ncbi:MAG: YhjD/YihY/BrkB family envelope integrity protein [Myxococcota bacterium]
MVRFWNRIRSFWLKEIWHQERYPAWLPPYFGRMLVVVSRMLYVVVSSFARERLKLRAAALTYVSLLSLVPALAVAFSLFTAFGGLEQVGNKLREEVIRSLAGAQQETVVRYLDQFIQGANAGRVGAIGTAFLFVTVIFLVADVERAFNDIWGVTRGRSWLKRFQVFWPLITVGPLVVGLTFSLTAAIAASDFVRTVEDQLIGAQILGRLGATALTCLFFGFMYQIVPNTSVRWDAALVGGLVGGLFWALAQNLYAVYAANAITYSAIYGSLSAIPLFIVWVYLSWNIALLGAVMTFAIQSARTYEPERPVSQHERELVAAQVALAVALRFGRGDGPVPTQQLIDDANVPPRIANQVLEELVDAGFLAEAALGEGIGFLPARPPDQTTLFDVLRALRHGNNVEALDNSSDAFGRIASRVLNEGENRLRESLDQQNLAQLAARIDDMRSSDRLEALSV